MEPTGALRGHPRSISSLMTILPLSLEGADCRATSPPRQRSPWTSHETSDPVHVPLPPSIPGSERESSTSGGTEQKAHIPVEPVSRERPLYAPVAALESQVHSAAGNLTQSPRDPPRIETPDPLAIPLPSSSAGSHRGRPSLSHSRRTSLLSTRTDDHPDVEGDQMDRTLGPSDSNWLLTDPVGDIPLRPMSSAQPVTSSFTDTMSLVQRAMNTRVRAVELQRELVRLIHHSGGNGRCLGVQSFLYKRLVECFRLEMKSPFVTMFDQMQECWAIFPSHEPERRQSDSGAASLPSNATVSNPSWVLTLPVHSQPGVMKLLNSLRTSPAYLAERISALNSSQLRNLAKPHVPSGRTESSTESSPNNRADLRMLRPWSRTSTPSVEGLAQDPLRLMILSCFDPTAVQGLSDRARQLEIWSRACARLIDDQRVGSNEFCFAVLEIVADVTPWELSAKLELFLLELIHTGTFLTNATNLPSAASNKGAELPSAAHSEHVASFFERAVESLLDLVVSNAAFSVPNLALDLIHATLRKLDDPQKIARARRFFVYTWYCNTFLSSAVLFPERHRILLNVHISSDIRQKLLRELATRVQKVVRDVLDPRSSSPSRPTAVSDKVERLVSIFDESYPRPRNAHTNVSRFERPFVVLFAEDVLAITKALYPNDPSEPSEKIVNSEPVSSPSSVTGSSTLTAGTNDFRSGINSAFTPSISGTSVTSHTLSSDFFLKSPEKAADTVAAAIRSRPTSSDGMDGKIEEIPVQSFLSELWKLCASRKSSNSPQVTVESAIFFVECPSGRLNCQTSRTLDGDLSVQMASEECAADSTVPKDILVIMRALSKTMNEEGFHRHSCVEAAAADPILALETLFRLHLDQARCQHEFQSSFFWFHALKSLKNASSALGSSLISELAQRYAATIQGYVSTSERYQEWIHSLQATCATQARRLAQLGTQTAALRIKMWYVTDVRHSDAYEHTTNVVKALSTMAKPPAPKQHGVAAWAQRLRVSFGHEKAQAQAFDLISASKTCGGPNKLSDEQADMTSRWLTKESIENFCGGEERMHRFCFEIQRCVTKLVGATMSESPVLWSSSLFGASSERHGNARSNGRSQSGRIQPNQVGHDGLGSSMPPYADSSARFGRDRGLGLALNSPNSLRMPSFGQGSLPDPFIDSGADFRSSLRVPFPPSPVSLATSPARVSGEQDWRPSFVENLKRDVAALLISDLGHNLWISGSETDNWINSDTVPLSNAAEALQDRGQANVLRDFQGPNAGLDATHDQPTFDFREGYAKLLSIFRFSLDPHQKLQALFELSILAECQSLSMDDQIVDASAPVADLPLGLSKLVAQARGVPRIRLTRLQEVVANCNERRQASRRSSSDVTGSLHHILPGMSSSSARDISNALAIVSTLFLDGRYRPATLFRDLQLIASFVPSATLDSTPHGTVFWTVGLVAMGLKSETCRLMTRRATAIVDYHVNSHTPNRKEPIRAGGPRAPPPESEAVEEAAAALSPAELAATTLADAARFYLLSALEGEPAAARELALFYLTHPELLRPAMLPLSRPGDVLRSINLLGGGVERRGAGESGGDATHGSGGSGGGGVLDPPTFAIAYHWMEFAANAGDADAQTFLVENRDLGGVF